LIAGTLLNGIGKYPLQPDSQLSGFGHAINMTGTAAGSERPHDQLSRLGNSLIGNVTVA